MFECLKGTLIVWKIFWWLYRFIRNTVHKLPWWVRSKVQGHEVAFPSLKDSSEGFIFILKFLGDLFKLTKRNILVVNGKNKIPENLRKKTPNVLLATVISLSRALEISRKYLLPRKVILQKKGAGCACSISVLHIKNTILHRTCTY